MRAVDIIIKKRDKGELTLAEIEEEMKAFEREERKRLGLEEEPAAQWHDPNPQTFTRARMLTRHRRSLGRLRRSSARSRLSCMDSAERWTTSSAYGCTCARL